MALLAFFGCQDSRDDLMIRVCNVSAYSYTGVYVNTSGGEHFYGDLSAGQTSEYLYYDFAYRYAFIELQIDGDTFTIQPIDYVGETTLPGGNYTYEVDADASDDRYGRLSLELVED